MMRILELAVPFEPNLRAGRLKSSMGATLRAGGSIFGAGGGLAVCGQILPALRFAPSQFNVIVRILEVGVRGGERILANLRGCSS